MAKKKKTTWAHLLGFALAHVQHNIDRVCLVGFHKIREMGHASKKRKSDAKHPYKVRAKKAGKGMLRFLGSMGESYYERYEELKGRG